MNLRNTSTHPYEARQLPACAAEGWNKQKPEKQLRFQEGPAEVEEAPCSGFYISRAFGQAFWRRSSQMASGSVVQMYGSRGSVTLASPIRVVTPPPPPWKWPEKIVDRTSS